MVERRIDYSRDLLDNDEPVILCGDFNVVPTPIDAAVYFPESRKAYAAILEDGWTDAVRQMHPEKGVYADWNFSYRGGYDRTSGLRMDHLLLNPPAARRLLGAGVDVETRGWEKPSDHARHG